MSIDSIPIRNTKYMYKLVNTIEQFVHDFISLLHHLNYENVQVKNLFKNMPRAREGEHK